jgi:DNA-directed RNA polymerase subunit beta'
MEEPARRILGVTQKGLMDLLSGKEEVDGKFGGKGLEAALKKIDVDAEISRAEQEIKSGRKSHRDDAVKRLGFLKTMKENKSKPVDMMLRKIPVIPPVYRPVSVASSGIVVSDANLLYRDLMNAKAGLQGLKGELPESALTSERTHLYNATKAVVGLGDPVSIKNKNKNVKGFIRQIVGNTPKTGMFQSKVLGKQQDVTGRAVVVPDPTLDMDQVGLPEEMAWKVFKPFTMRKMVTRGVPASRASQEIDDRTPGAKKALQVVMEERPVLVNRNPSLHKFNLMALRPVLRSDRNIAMPATIASGFNLDHDGDQMNLHVPVTDAAVNEAYDKMLPSSNLFSLKNRRAHFLPMQESTLGLFKATTREKSGKVKKFSSKSEALAAYRRGEVEVDDPIEIAS